jgi:flagellar FliL protein
MIIAITLLACATFFYYAVNQAISTGQPTTKQKPPDINEQLRRSIQTGKMTTNLYTGEIVQMDFQIEADSEKVKTNLEKRLPDIKNIIISTLQSMKLDDIRGAKGIENVETTVMEKLNQSLYEGRVTQVKITEFLYQ